MKHDAGTGRNGTGARLRGALERSERAKERVFSAFFAALVDHPYRGQKCCQ